MRILIADDNDLFRAFLGRVIAAYGFCPMFARDGREALDLMGALDPHLVFTDTEMPELDGFGLLAAIRAQHGASIPVVAVTARWPDTAQADYVAAGFDWAIEKPLRPDQVLAVLRAIGAVTQMDGAIQARALTPKDQAAPKRRGFRSRPRAPRRWRRTAVAAATGAPARSS